jgi:hypothetical protein
MVSPACPSQNFCKPLMMTSNQSQDEYEKARKDIIDSAYLINPEYAKSIASALDTDEARRAARTDYGYGGGPMRFHPWLGCPK